MRSRRRQVLNRGRRRAIYRGASSDCGCTSQRIWIDYKPFVYILFCKDRFAKDLLRNGLQSYPKPSNSSWILTMIYFASLVITQAISSDETEVLSRMQQTINAANRKIDTALASNFMPSVVLVDDLAPYVFQGPAADAILEWRNAYDADSVKNSITDFSMQLLKPRRVEVSGDRAYIVLPAVYSFKQRLRPMQKLGTITATLERLDKKWLIATWSWAGQ